MGLCEGLNDWFKCIECPFLCTKSCPIENEDAFLQFTTRLRHIEQNMLEESDLS